MIPSVGSFFRAGTHSPKALLAREKLKHLKRLQKDSEAKLETARDEYDDARRKLAATCARYFELQRQVDTRAMLILEAEIELRSRT